MGRIDRLVEKQRRDAQSVLKPPRLWIPLIGSFVLAVLIGAVVATARQSITVSTIEESFGTLLPPDKPTLPVPVAANAASDYLLAIEHLNAESLTPDWKQLMLRPPALLSADELDRLRSTTETNDYTIRTAVQAARRPHTDFGIRPDEFGIITNPGPVIDLLHVGLLLYSKALVEHNDGSACSAHEYLSALSALVSSMYDDLETPMGWSSGVALEERLVDAVIHTRDRGCGPIHFPERDATHLFNEAATFWLRQSIAETRRDKGPDASVEQILEAYEYFTARLSGEVVVFPAELSQYEQELIFIERLGVRLRSVDESKSRF